MATVTSGVAGDTDYTVEVTGMTTDGDVIRQPSRPAGATDAATNLNTTSSTDNTVTWDTTAPTGSLTMNSGATYTNSTSVTLNLNATDTNGIVSYRVANGSDCSSASFVTPFTAISPYSANPAFTLVGGDGTRTVCVQYKDAAGNLSTTYTDTIIQDTTAPTGSLTMNSGATYTNSTSVTLNLNATDTNGIVSYRVANGSDCSSASFVTPFTAISPYSANPAFTLVGGDGTRTVCVQYKDAAGNLSTTYTDTIIQDTTAPTNAITFPLDLATYSEASWNAGCSTVLVGDMCGTAGDAGSGLANVTISLKRSDGWYFDFTSNAFVNSPQSKTFTTGASWTEGLDFSKFSPATSYELKSIATDNASNTTTRTATFNINVIDLDFQSPIDDSTATPPTVVINKGKYGRVIPVKINVFQNGVQQTSTHIAEGLLTIKVVTTSCSTGVQSDTIEQYADAGSSNGNTNQFRATGSGWIYNLDTKALSMTINSCYRLDVYLSGVKISTQHFAIFQPTK